ncbi:citryl-CoA lyase [Phytohabitans sp. ZYX-F-186]|uniref:citrate synthase (unknown stereospecificity) n=1 Tax=Phytohabitans maris TaxID=3071409 RepID=A0ABU0ZCM8_9ACTN|nr:citryl-CoA lyase [Phytohabitans sp. ZYX-F-186]MDQ7904816.1 citryl-CoA lyase [Phytohabitans sp. ZYX-F-186]
MTTVQDVSDWWATGVSRVEPGVIELRGRPVQELIGTTSFASTIWLMLRGDLPTATQERLLEAALVASVDHGPHAPSIAAARIAATCGVGLNNAVATGVNLLGDTHGGAGQQCLELLADVLARQARGDSLETAATAAIAAWRDRSRYLPGFGHRFHTVDPRREPLLSLVDEAVSEGAVKGDILRAGRAVEAVLNEGRARPIPMNVDGATAIIYGELGFPAPLARGLFVLGRSVGILAHAWEESQQGRRNKGPMPPGIAPTFLGSPATG